MSVPAADGAWVSATRVTRIDCDRCGVVESSRYPLNDREERQAITRHLLEKHDGHWRPATRSTR